MSAAKKTEDSDHSRSAGGGMDRRRHPRFTVDVMLEDVYQLDAFMAKERGKVVNLSEGGMAMVTRGQYKSDASLVFTFALPNGMRLNDVKGRVARAQKEENGEWFHGIEFTDLGFFNKLKLKWFLSRTPQP